MVLFLDFGLKKIKSSASFIYECRSCLELCFTMFEDNFFLFSNTVDIGHLSYDSNISNLFVIIDKIFIEEIISLDSFSNEIYIDRIDEIRKKNNLIRNS